eukprot:CAMPEP_0172502094 /NCGR_PEP_ID=MMETSP1066-20121228/156604_1 /TAXON_ID=671091 /ORGANISM="Coscinodiscus wailesii, Strain CCMP2513" /LENGTH=399 /DNA_ID=CAMNT_0013277219 /DNA_START=154 /DNA_END=1350 /DNA_ORIENTATION=+
MKTKDEYNYDGELTTKKKKKWGWMPQKYLRLTTPNKKKNDLIVLRDEEMRTKSSKSSMKSKKGKETIVHANKDVKNNSRDANNSRDTNVRTSSSSPSTIKSETPQSQFSVPKRLFDVNDNNDNYSKKNNNGECDVATNPSPSVTSSSNKPKRKSLSVDTTSTAPPTPALEEPWTPTFPALPPASPSMNRSSSNQQNLHLSHLRVLSREHMLNLQFDNDMIRNRVVGTGQIENYDRFKSELSLLVKSALGRSFQRPSKKKWQVTVEDATWDSTLSRYTYRIILQDKVSTPPIPPNTQLRTFQDFCWLEESLRQEYQGALLCPPLNIRLQQHKDEHQQHKDEHQQPEPDLNLTNPIPGQTLSTWLEDILNGWRCTGEYFLPPPSLLSESLETFLYLSPPSP